MEISYALYIIHNYYTLSEKFIMSPLYTEYEFIKFNF
jgi:hypothetical protein